MTAKPKPNSKRRPKYRILIGILAIVAGLAVWLLSFEKGVFGGIRAGDYVPGFSIYNGSLHFWADYNGDSETHFRTNDLEFLTTGSDGGNAILVFGRFGGPNSSNYKFDFDLPLWLVPTGGLVCLLFGWRARRVWNAK